MVKIKKVLIASVLMVFFTYLYGAIIIFKKPISLELALEVGVAAFLAYITTYIIHKFS